MITMARVRNFESKDFRYFNLFSFIFVIYCISEKKFYFLKFGARAINILLISFAFIIAASIFFEKNAIASQQTKYENAIKKSTPVDNPGVARFIRDENGVSILEFAGEYNIGLNNPRKTIAKEFIGLMRMFMIFW